MNHPVCIYLDSETATRAAAAARKKGATASVKVEPLLTPSNGEVVNLFVLETDLNERQMVIDAIADADRHGPGLVSNALRCPSCQSIQIEYPETPTRSPVLRGLGRVMNWISKKDGLTTNGSFRCRKCSHQWKPEATERPRGVNSRKSQAA